MGMKRTLIAGIGILTAMAFAAPAGAQSRGRHRRSAPPVVQFSPQNVPGLGFDYPHLAAVTPRSNVSQHAPRFDTGQFIVPIWGAPAYYAPQPAPQPVQPIVIVLQQPAPVAPNSSEDRGNARGPEAEPPAPAAAPEPAPLRELEPYVLMRRDGERLLAAAFSSSGDRLVYITPDGARRFLALSELDVERTREINEDAGRNIVLPR
jgi:hypothetical protein